MKPQSRTGIPLLAIALVLSLSIQAHAARNVILMIGDGMGSEHVKAGSYYLTGSEGKLSFEPFYQCTVTTRSLDAEVTDSAASATTMATGNKTNNGVLSQSPDGHIYYTILEQAREMGKRTGLVTTAPISDATPAAFGAHEPARGNYANIVNDFLDASRPNIMFGGGDPDKGRAGFFSTEQIAKARTLGYRVVRDITGLNSLNPSTDSRAVGLFAGACTTLECQRRLNCTEPHLSQMTTKALAILNRDPDGFFLMVEGALIDKTAHHLDINGVAAEAAEFSNAVAVVLEWMRSHPDTLLIVTADHETGGLSVSPCAKGEFPPAKWSTQGGHTATNVPLYATGADVALVKRYIKNGVMDDTDIYRIMRAALGVQPGPGKKRPPH